MERGIMTKREIRDLVADRQWENLEKYYKKDPNDRRLSIITDVIIDTFCDEEIKARGEQIPDYAGCMDFLLLTDSKGWSPAHEVVRYGYWDVLEKGFAALSNRQKKQDAIHGIADAVRDVHIEEGKLMPGAEKVLKIVDCEGWTVAHGLACLDFLPEEYRTKDILEMGVYYDGLSVGYLFERRDRDKKEKIEKGTMDKEEILNLIENRELDELAKYCHKAPEENRLSVVLKIIIDRISDRQERDQAVCIDTVKDIYLRDRGIAPAQKKEGEKKVKIFDIDR